MPPEKSEAEQFIEETQQDILDQPINPEKEETKLEDVEEVEDPSIVANRRHRRLEAKLQQEREANIALAERLKVIAETKGATAESDSLKKVERIYGTDTPEAAAATELLKEALLDLKREAKEETFNAWREEQRQEAAKLREEEARLDSMVEELEDEYGVTLTPDMQKSFFKQLEKVSPKDEDGNVIAYADHRSVWEDIQERVSKRNNRAKEISTRSMVQGSGASDSKLQADSAERALKEMGII